MEIIGKWDRLCYHRDLQPPIATPIDCPGLTKASPAPTLISITGREPAPPQCGALGCRRGRQVGGGLAWRQHHTEGAPSRTLLQVGLGWSYYRDGWRGGAVREFASLCSANRILAMCIGYIARTGPAPALRVYRGLHLPPDRHPLLPPSTHHPGIWTSPQQRRPQRHQSRVSACRGQGGACARYPLGALKNVPLPPEALNRL